MVKVHLSEQPYKLLDVKILQRAGLDTGYESVPRTAYESLMLGNPFYPGEWRG
jgi:hypothetical protein